jgi:hypothetical protein
MAKSTLRVDRVEVAAAFLLLLQVAALGQVGQDLLEFGLGDVVSHV